MRRPNPETYIWKQNGFRKTIQAIFFLSQLPSVQIVKSIGLPILMTATERIDSSLF